MLLDLSDGVIMLLDGCEIECGEMGSVIMSSLEVRGTQTLKADKLPVVKYGHCAFRKIDSIESTGDGWDLSVGSDLELLDVRSVKTAGKMFKLDNSRVECRRFTKFESGGNLFDLDNDSIVHLTDVGETVSLKSSSAIINGKTKGTVSISNSVLDTLNGLLKLNGDWSVAVTDCTLSGGASPLIDISGGSVLNIKSCDSIKGTGSVVINLVDTDAFFTGITVTNNGSLGCITTSSTTDQQQLQVSKSNLQSLDLEGYSCDFFAVQFEKYSFNFCDVKTRRCVQTGSQATEDSLFVDSVLLDRMSTWESSIHNRTSVLNHWKSIVSDNWVSKDSVVRVDGAFKQGSVGFIAEDGSDIGSTVAAAGWAVDNIQAGDSNKDAFWLSNASFPTYSGSGAAFILSSQFPDVGSLNFASVAYNNIRILDSRNSYIDITNRQVRYSPTDIEDDATTDYKLNASQIAETATSTFTATGTSSASLSSSGPINLNGASINEVPPDT